MTIVKEEYKFSEKELFHLQPVHHKFHTDCSGIKIWAPLLKNRTGALLYSMEQRPS